MYLEEYILSSEQQFVIFLVISLVVEYVVAIVRDMPTVRVNDGLHSLSSAVICSIPRLLVTNVQTVVYSLVYLKIHDNTNSNLVPSPLQRCITILGVDLCYYWFHRAAHEINLFWAAHQVHHSSEDYNITTSMRQSVVQQFIAWTFYLPLAFIGIHPSSMKEHLWFSCLYQMWTHTEVIDHLGPLEYVFVTPSHHRVHHGRNPYCIDKNYGGILIIWDRVFGTFAEEKDNSRPVYGLVVERVNTWNPIWPQFSHYYGLAKAFWNMPGVLNKLYLVFKGPSWSPGKARLGNGCYQEIQYPVVKYDKTLPLPVKLYVIGHFLLILFFYYKYLEISSCTSFGHTLGVILYLLLSLTTFGALFDHKWYGPFMEACRCIIFLIIESFTKQDWGREDTASSMVTPMTEFVRSIFILSLAIWFLVETTGLDWAGNGHMVYIVHHSLNTEVRQSTAKPSQFTGNSYEKKDFNRNILQESVNRNTAMFY